MMNLIKALKIKTIIRYTTTTTTTETVTENIPDNNILIPKEMNIPASTTSATTQEILNNIEENKKIYENILEKTKPVNDMINDINVQPAIKTTLSTTPEIKENINETDHSFANSNQYYDVLKDQVQQPEAISSEDDIIIDIENAVLPIIASCKLTGDTLAKKLVDNGISIEESENAEVRQQALYVRIKEFVDSFGITKTALRIGFGVAITYTIYNLIRYRQIPLGGFIKGLITSTSGISSSEAVSNSINPTNNITITMPSIDTIKQNIPTSIPSPTTIGTFIDQIGPTGWLVIGGIIWLLQKRK